MENLPHDLQLRSRSRLTMTGVTEVVSFDENTVALRTNQGDLTVHGQQLQLKQLSQEGGQVAVDGTISALVYQELRQSGGFWHRLMG